MGVVMGVVMAVAIQLKNPLWGGGGSCHEGVGLLIYKETTNWIYQPSSSVMVTVATALCTMKPERRVKT